MTRWIHCREFVEFLDDYLAGRLAPEQVEEFNNHLSGCPHCVTYMKTYQEAVALGKGSVERTDEPVPGAVPEELVQAILAARSKK
jgi:anti-sigma factor RsiW